MTTAAVFLFGVVFGLVGYAWLSAPERRRAQRRLGVAQQQAENWANAYHTKVREQATLLALIDGDPETPVNHQLRAEMGLRHLPLHDAISQRMAAQIDAEWLELDLSEGER